MHVSTAWAKPQRINLILIGSVEATSQGVVLGPMATGDTLVKIV
jgi:hypothetical protein